MSMLHVVVSDCGLNGPIVHGVYSAPPDAHEVERFTHAEQVTPDGFHYKVASLTGYQGTQVHALELDGPLT